MGIFDTLNIGYSGLSSSQTSINVTSNNISNVNTPGYSKQRAVQTTNHPLEYKIPGSVGTGSQIYEIKRVHDEYLYARSKISEANLEFARYTNQTLKEISDYFPDLEDNGIAKDLQDFFASWSDLSQDPDNDAQKVVVANNTIKLTSHIKDTRDKLKDLQNRLNDEFKEGIEKVNDLAKQIADINKKINKIENVAQGNANDLRDQRDRLEKEMNKLLNISVHKGKLHPDKHQVFKTDRGNDYNINISGFNIVDGITFHPITIDVNKKFYTASYQSHDGTKVDFTSKIRNGKLGAIVKLRGDGIDANQKASNSKIQSYIDDLDSFAKGFIQKVNSLYAQSAQTKVQSDVSMVKSDTKLLELDDINEGSFNVIVYNNQGDIVAKRAITIDNNTTLDDGSANSIISQINADIDDNGDNDSTNDLDDIYEAKVLNNTLIIEQKAGVSGYHIAIEDNNTNFAGYFGVHKFFDGSDASSIDLDYDIRTNPSNLQSFKPPVDGNSDFANDMVELQYEELNFKRANNQTISQTVEGFYRFTVSNIATDATNANIEENTAESLNKSIDQQLKSTVGVDMDEELTNLMKYQTAYQASAKIISTIDQMINTLLGIKQ